MKHSAMRISVVIPALNEEKALPGLLAALLSQTKRPDEIIVVDADSTDGTVRVVEDWSQKAGVPIRCLKGRRGGCAIGRNIGIKAAAHDWIVLLDCGMEPIPNWLASLERTQQQSGSLAVFGKCQYVPGTEFQKAVCALAWGERPVTVVPCALIHRSVFETIGFFREDLRAVEDQEWTGRFLRYYGNRCEMQDAVTPHLDVPDSLPAVYRKWVLYYECAVTAVVLVGSQVLYLSGVAMLLLALLYSWETVSALFLLHMGVRGIVLPLSRGTPLTWLIKPANLAIVLLLALTIDVAKVLGFAAGRYGELKGTLRPPATAAPVAVLSGSVREDLQPIRLTKTTLINTLGRSGAVLFPLFVAYRYGATDMTDALFWITGLIFWLGGGISVAAELVSVPLVTREQKEDLHGTSGVLMALSLRSLQWGVPIMVLLFIIGTGSVLLTPLLSDHVKNLAFLYLLEVLPVVVLMLLTAVWTAALAAHGAFTASGWTMALKWFLVLATVPLLAIPSVVPFWAVVFLVGELGRFGLLNAWARAIGIWKGFRVQSESRSVRDIAIAPFVLQTLAMFAINATPVIDKAMGAVLGPGNISLFEYAWIAYLIPSGIVTSGLLVVLYTEWSRVFSFQGAACLGATVRQAYFRTLRWTTLLALLLLAISGWYWNHPVPLGSLSANQGREFIGVLGALSLGIPGVLAGLVAMRGLLVIQNNQAILYIALGKCGLNVLLNWVLIAPLGLIGIGLATAITELLTAGCLYGAFVGSLRKLDRQVVYG